MAKYFPKIIAFPAIVALFSLSAASQQVYRGNNNILIPGNTTPEQVVRMAAEVTPSPRQLKWQQMELTTFLHFTMNTFYNREWGMGNEDPALFNPTRLDASQWVKVCREAGSRSVILTCKHHDGFCLWPSAYTDHDVAASPWRNGKGDIVREVSEACRQQGIGFGVYLSPWDRHEKTYGTEEYNVHFKNQLTELLTHYGPVTEVWFDGACGEGPNGKKQVYDWEGYYSLIRKLQPDAVIAVMGPDVRWVGTESGYGRETEWSVVPVDLTSQEKIAGASQQEAADEGFIPAGDMTDPDLGSREKIAKAQQLVWYPSEVDVSIRPGWFWHESENSRVKTPEKLFDIYFSSTGRNSLLLLNIPPDSRGLIHENDIASLAAWRKAIDHTFRHNLAKQARPAGAEGEAISHIELLTDGRDDTHWDMSGLSNPVTLEMDLGSEQTFDVLALQENLRVGQRIEKFRLEAELNGKWMTVAQGTTVGYKRLLRFDPVTARKVRLIIDESRTVPALAEFGLYLRPPAVAITPENASFRDSVLVKLSTRAKDTLILYTLDGSQPGKNALRYTGPITVTKTTELNCVAVSADGLEGFARKATYNKALYGITLANACDPQYNGGGPLGLLDGARGSLDFGDGRWTGFNGVEMDATVDLGEVKAIKKISASFLEVTQSWIFKPAEVQVLVSENGTDFIPVKSANFDLPGSDEEGLTEVVAPGNLKARFIRVTASPVKEIPSWHPAAGNPAWIFCDEIIVE